MKFAPNLLGRLGERFAAWFYRLRGYSIVDRNVRFAAGEIDLVARRGSTLVIAEVKTRQTKRGEGHEAVTRAKRERMIRLGDQYAARHPGTHLRYDVISIFWTGWWFAITQYADAFRPVAAVQQPWRWRAGAAFRAAA